MKPPYLLGYIHTQRHLSDSAYIVLTLWENL